MEINSVVKRNNPVWNKETTQANYTLPALPSMSVVTGTIPATYIMITNTSTLTVDITNMATPAARGIPLAPGATFETAIALPPPGAAPPFYAITVASLVPAAPGPSGGEVITVTYFNN